MRTGHVLAFCALALVALLLAGLTHAATGKMGTAEGEDDEPVIDCEEVDGDETDDEDCVVEAKWNPVITCNPESGDDIFDLLDCLITSGSPGCQGAGISTPDPPTSIGDPGGFVDILATNDPEGCVVPHETGDYFIAPLDEGFGFSVYRVDGSEIDHLTLLETIPGIKWTEIEVIQEDLVARIAGLVENPTRGTVTVWLNERSAKVDTRLYGSGAELTRALASAIRDQGFSVGYERGSILVTWDNLENRGLTRLGLETTDPAIIRSELALEPREQSEFTLDPLLQH